MTRFEEIELWLRRSWLVDGYVPERECTKEQWTELVWLYVDIFNRGKTSEDIIKHLQRMR